MPTTRATALRSHFRPRRGHDLAGALTLASAGMILALMSPLGLAQSTSAPRVSCVVDDSGTGWRCETGAGYERASAAASALDSSSTSSSASASRRPPSGAASRQARLDWVAREAMTPAQREALAEDCCGGFIDPLSDVVAPITDDTLFEASAGLTQQTASSVDLGGEVTVTQGARRIVNSGGAASTNTTIDREANTIDMQGDIAFREPGILLRGERAFIDSANANNQLESAYYVLHESGIHGSAQQISYDSESGLVSIENGEFSRCEPGEEFWSLRAQGFELDQAKGRGSARKVSLRLRDIPVFYYPGTVQFPLGDERLSGFLPPSLGSSRTGGADIEIPYYLNLAPQLDATLRPRLLSDRGLMLGGELRYLGKRSMNTLNAAFLGDDKLFDPATAQTLGADSPSQPDRWFLGFEHEGQFGDSVTTYVDYNAVSDNDYFFDFGNGGLNLSSQTHLNRQARIDFRSSVVNAGLNVQRLQIIDPFAAALDINRPFDRLPQFTFATGTALGYGFRIALAGEATMFDRSLDEALLSEAKIDAGALVSGTRVNLEPELSWGIERPGWFLRAKSKYLQRSYSLERQAVGTDSSPDFGVAVTSLDAGLIFERATASGGTQTLEPRLFALDSGFAEQAEIPLFDSSELNFSFAQLFRDERFAGGDRVSNARQLSAAVTSRVFGSDGREQARFSLGQTVFFEDRLVDLSNPLQSWAPRYSPTSTGSAYVAEAAYSLGDRWRFLADVQWDEEAQEVIEGRVQMRYSRGSSQLINLAYRERNLVSSPNLVLPPAVEGAIDPHIRQTDVSAVWPLGANWKILGRWNYDHSNARNLETFGGVEYGNCCVKIRVVAREWINENELFVRNFEPNRGVFLQFTLLGLGDLSGGGLDRLLTEGIQGYDSRSLR